MPPHSENENFLQQASFNVQDLIPVEKFRSKRTGLTVCIAKVPGPLVNGYFCIATEAHDDDGLPHTLEHLVFMGSEKYPYKGMLDLFANRCLAQGTNAWTDTDHTCYTMTTAGSEGFLNLLPIYLDHVLYPTLTKSAYITEVHHINGEGEDAGIVYCEMQARENTGDSRTYLDFLRNMYPGVCGYKSETGGIMENLRTSCSHKKVCEYHRTFYRPDNLCLIITGEVDAGQVLQCVGEFEEKILAKGALPPFDRPWQNPVPVLRDSVVKLNLFPTEDESTGMVILGWRGPQALEYYTLEGMKVLFTYLTDTPVAPLQQDLVEIEEPYCSDIKYSMLENLETCFLVKLEGVVKEHLSVLKDRVKEVLKKLVSKEIVFDMNRVKTLLHREVLESMNALEDCGHDTMAQYCIGDFLYSDNPEKLRDYCDRMSRLEKLKQEGLDYWLHLIQTFLLKRPSVVIEGDPSEDLMTKMSEEEKKRIEQQRKALGEKGLQEKKELLENATTVNELEPPSDIVTSLPVPSTDSISFHHITTISNRSNEINQSPINLPVHEIPFAFQVDHIKSLFVQITALCDTSALPDKLRMLLPLYSELLFESPILRGKELIPYEDVVNQLAADTLETGASVGFGGHRFSAGRFSKVFDVSLKVETSKFEKGIQWLQEVFYGLQFSGERIRVVANKIINDVPSFKRSGRKVVGTLIADINFTKDSNAFVMNVTRQQDFLSNLLKRLETNAAEVIKDLEELRGILTNPQGLRLYVAADANRLPTNAIEIIKTKFAKPIAKMAVGGRDAPVVPSDSSFLRSDVISKIVGIGSVESSFLCQSCPTITSYTHPDYAPLLVFIEYLSALEGPLWRQIRGLGLSYHYNIVLDPSTGLLRFVLFKSAQIVDAYKKANEIMNDYLSGKTKFEKSQIEAAISGVIFGIIAKEQSVGDAAAQSILSEFKGVGRSFSRDLLHKLSEVTVDDLVRVGKTYFTKLFDSTVSSCAICCHPSKVQGVVKGFKKLGRPFVIVKSLEEEFLP